MKKLFACLLCMALLFCLIACKTEPAPAPNEDTPSNPSSADNNNAPSSNPSGDVIENRSHLLNGMSLEEKAIFLWNGMFDDESDIDDTVESGTMELALAMVGTSQGYALNADMKGKSLHVEGAGSIKPFDYEEMSATIRMEDDILNTTTTTKTGYANGKIFAYFSTDGEEYGVCATHSPADWKEYQALSVSDSSSTLPTIKEDFCQTKSFEWAGQGYTVSFSDFNENGLDAIGESIGDLIDILDETPTDARLSASFRRDLLPLEMKIEFVFEATDNETEPSCVITFQFKNYNNTHAFLVDMHDYDDAGDLLAARKVLHYKKAIPNAKQAVFTTKMDMTIKQSGSTVGANTTSTDISLKNTANDGFSFTRWENSAVQAIYANGAYSTPGQSPIEVHESQAKSLIEGFLDPLAIEIYWVKKAELRHESASGRLFVIELAACDPELYQVVCSRINATDKNIVVKNIYMTCEEDANGNLEKLSYWIAITTREEYSATLQIDVHSMDIVWE